MRDVMQRLRLLALRKLRGIPLEQHDREVAELNTAHAQEVAQIRAYATAAASYQTTAQERVLRGVAAEYHKREGELLGRVNRQRAEISRLQRSATK